MTKWFFYNDNWHEGSPEDIIPSDCNRIYEVLRVINGKPLFLEDHFDRFDKSLAEAGIQNPIQFLTVKTILYEVLIRNTTDICNIRYELILENNQTTIAVYEVHFRYPDNREYEKGVNISHFRAERTNPHLKQTNVNNRIREALKAIYRKEKVFEVLLIDHFGNITEGSRSNVFFVKKQTLISPPSESMLEGITRKKVIQLASEKGIKCIEKSIRFEEISSFDACFLTGTSPKVLPVKQIGSLLFDPQNDIIAQLVVGYNLLIEAYIRD